MAAPHMSRESEVVAMNLDCELVLPTLVAAAEYAGLALLIVVFHSRIALVIPKLWEARKIVEL